MKEKKEAPASFLRNLRYLMLQTGQKDYKIAKNIGIHRVTLSRLFTDGMMPGAFTVAKIAKYFDVDAGVLVYGNLLPALNDNNEDDTSGDIICGENEGDIEQSWKERAIKAEKKLRDMREAALELALASKRLADVLLDK